MIPKAKEEFTLEERAKVQKNHGAQNIFVCVIDSSEFDSVSTCKIHQEYQTLVGYCTSKSQEL